MLKTEGRITFIYAGVMGVAQGLHRILDVATCLSDLDQVQFVLVGEGAERESLTRRVESEKIQNVRVLGPQPKERIPALLAAADGVCNVLKFSIPGAVPSKIYEAMATGLPRPVIGLRQPSHRLGLAVCDTCGIMCRCN